MIIKKNISKKMKLASLITFAGFSASVGAATGQLVVINSLANYVNGSPGLTGSAIRLVVKDGTTACSTTSSLALGSLTTINWDDSKTPSSTQCSKITTVEVSPIKTSANNLVQYDSTNKTPGATSTATVATAPTTAIKNLVLIVSGTGSSTSSTGNTTTWGYSAGSTPTYDTTNGLITTTGVPGFVGTSGLRAAKTLLQQDLEPQT
jgi:hypothetical protein